MDGMKGACSPIERLMKQKDALAYILISMLQVVFGIAIFGPLMGGEHVGTKFWVGLIGLLVLTRGIMEVTR